MITEQKLRYQANMAMAFGAETLVWACWTKGWWTMNVLDENGAKTVPNGPVPLRRTADGRHYAFDLKSNGAVLVVFEM